MMRIFHCNSMSFEVVLTSEFPDWFRVIVRHQEVAPELGSYAEEFFVIDF